MRPYLALIIFAVAAGGALYPKFTGDRRFHFRFDMDLEGGVRLFYRVPDKVREEKPPEELDRDLEGCRARLEARLHQFYGSDPQVILMRREGILVEVPGTRNIQRVLKAIGLARSVNVRGVKATQPLELDERIDLGGEIEYDKLRVMSTAARPLERGQLTPPNSWGVTLPLTERGATKFSALAEKYFDKPVAILLDDDVETIAILKARGGTDLIITGMDAGEAETLRKILSSGPLPISLELEQQQSVDPLFGKALRRSAERGLLIGLVLLAVFLVILYLDRPHFWVVLFLTTAVTCMLLIATANLGWVVISMTGLAGIALLIGMNVDSQVLMFEEIIQRFAKSEQWDEGVKESFTKAVAIVFVGNLTTVLALGGLARSEGELRNYFFLTAVGIAINTISFMFAHCLMATSFIKSLSEAWKVTGRLHDLLEGPPRRLRDWLSALPEKKLLGPGSPLGLLLLMLPVTALILVLWRGLPWGVELQGGTEFELALTRQVDEARVHEVVNAFFDDTCEVQHLQDTRNYIIRTRRAPGGEASAAELLRALETGLGQEVRLVHARSFGSWRAPQNLFDFFFSTVLALFLMTVVFWWIYKENPRVAGQALLALLCDVSVVLIAVQLFHIPISLPILAAIVTLIGYSVNDSVVIAHKIRDYVRECGRAPTFVVGSEEERDPAALVQANIRSALQSVMSRILITSASTMCPLVGLLFVGKGVLRDYAVVMLIGLIESVLSSYFIIGCWSVGFGEKRKYKN